jgi:ubiquitin carboxyl-terminal hydrolase 9/24
VLRSLINKNALNAHELDIIWSAQTGKHDVIQRNLHDLFARLANDFSAEQLEQLFERFKVITSSFIYIYIHYLGKLACC